MIRVIMASEAFHTKVVMELPTAVTVSGQIGWVDHLSTLSV